MWGAMQRRSLGHIGLWLKALALELGTFGVGVAMMFGPAAIVSGKPLDSARRVARTFGIAGGQELRAWGALFVVFGGVALAVLLARSSPLTRGWAVFPTAVLWSWWAVMYLGYSRSHDGLGLLGGISWGIVAATAVGHWLTLTGHEFEMHE